MREGIAILMLVGAPLFVRLKYMSGLGGLPKEHF